jgi:tetratricopeptide (TPR) repeat protein
MVKRPFSTSQSYLQYIRGLRELHALTMSGRDESPEADAIRDGMDHPWYDLSEIERGRIDGLSEDLYSISDSPKEPLLQNPQVQRKLNEAEEAWRAGEWDQALEILRRWSSYIDPSVLSSRRGLLWQAAGDNETAALFFDHAARLDPANGNYKSLYLLSLQQFAPDNALHLAKEITASDESYPPEVVIIAIRISLETDEGETSNIPGQTTAKLIPILERTLSRLHATGPDRPAWFVTFDVLAKFSLGYCQAQTGDLRKAIHSLDMAIAADPFDWGMLIYRGIVRYGIDPSAVEDFEKAIQLGSTVYDPYFVLAHRSAVTGRFSDCLSMCERALKCSPPGEICAFLHEWIAISRAELGHPPDQARSAFEEALRLDPDSDRIRNNLAAFEKSLVSQGEPKADWIKPKASTIQAFGRSEFRPPSSPIAA